MNMMDKTFYIISSLCGNIRTAVCGVLILWPMFANAADRLEIKDITGSLLRAERIGDVTPMPGGDTYARMTGDGRQIGEWSFRTGEQTGVLFSVDNTTGEHVGEIDGYILSPDGRKMLIQTGTEMIYRRTCRADYYIYDIGSRRLEKLSEGGKQQSPVWSNDATLVAFVRDNNIFLVKLLYDNAESQVTKDGEPGNIINGVPDWVNEEEFATDCSMVFTSDGKMICWVKYDESLVNAYTLCGDGGAVSTSEPSTSGPRLSTYKYPRAGDRNSTVSVHSFDIQSKVIRKLDVPVAADGYIPRIKQSPDADNIIVYTMNRHQDELCLYTVNARSTVARLLLKETSDCYVKEEAMENIQIGESSIVVPSDRSGRMQLYLYSMANGQMLRQLTMTDAEVTDVYGYDETTGDVYYQAIGRNAMNREVYVAAKNGKVTCLTPEDGWNTAIFSDDRRYFIRQWSDCDTPYRYTLCDNKGKTLKTLIDNQALRDRLAGYDLPEKEFVSFRTSEGVELNGVIIKPKTTDGTKRPLVMWQYGGPGSQQVVNSWGLGSISQGALFDAYLVQEGFVVACFDGRGTGGRGAEWEKCTYKQLGQKESRDQVEAAQYLGSLSYIDSSRIGIWGWSYGGFNTLMSMSEGRAVFNAGVAVAPVTDWRFYDTVYTERYMRTPNENAEGYDDNPIARVADMNGRLLICHGLADDNVHPQNTFEYSEALVQADKDFRMNVYKNRNHSIYGGNTRTHLLRQIARHFLEMK